MIRPEEQRNWQKMVRQTTLDLFGLTGPIPFRKKVRRGELTYHSCSPDATIEVPIFGNPDDIYAVTGTTTLSGRELVYDRQSIAGWHAACYNNQDPFTGGGRPGPLGGPIRDAADAENRIRIMFEMLVLLGWKGWHFHDTDLLWEFKTPQEYVDNMMQLADIINRLCAEFADAGYPGIKCPWLTSNTFSALWTMLGGADTYFADVADLIALQQKTCLDVGEKIGAKGIVFWGGRNGIRNPFIDMPHIQTAFGDAIIKATYKYGVQNCPSIEFYMREPKGKEPCPGVQHDRDTWAANANWQRLGLLGKPGIGINLEPFCHAPMAGIDPFTEMCIAFNAGNWFATDLNRQRNSEIGWDDDVFFSDIGESVQYGYFDVLMGPKRPYCLNNDARHRVSSSEHSLIHGLAGSADATMLGIAIASEIHKEGILRPVMDEFVADSQTPYGKCFIGGRLTLEEMAASSIKRGSLPKVRHDRTEDVNHLIQPFITRGSTFISH